MKIVRSDIEVAIQPALSDNYVYVLQGDDVTAVVDPGDARVVERFLEQSGRALDFILNTHHHHDHVAGNLALKRATGCRIFGPDDPRIPGLDQAVVGGMCLEVSGWAFQVLATPGHTRSCISYYLPEVGLAWTGDCLFGGGCGRLFECTPDVMWSSLKTLAALPDETLVYCGHEYTVDNLRFAVELETEREDLRRRLDEVESKRNRGEPTVPTTIGEEKKTNPFLCAPSVEVFADRRQRKDSF